MASCADGSATFIAVSAVTTVANPMPITARASQRERSLTARPRTTLSAKASAAIYAPGLRDEHHVHSPVLYLFAYTRRFCSPVTGLYSPSWRDLIPFSHASFFDAVWKVFSPTNLL